MELVDRIRQALRLKSDTFDGEIETLINSCRFDLKRAGVEIIKDDDPVFSMACIQYCKAYFGQDAETVSRERWRKCYESHRDAMAMSGDYGSVANAGKG